VSLPEPFLIIVVIIIVGIIVVFVIVVLLSLFGGGRAFGMVVRLFEGTIFFFVFIPMNCMERRPTNVTRRRGFNIWVGLFVLIATSATRRIVLVTVRHVAVVVVVSLVVLTLVFSSSFLMRLLRRWVIRVVGLRDWRPAAFYGPGRRQRFL
jgi:hypothetical protein